MLSCVVNTFNGHTPPPTTFPPCLLLVPGQCLELDYRRPTQQQVAKRMMGICGAEGLSLNEATMHALVEGANGDLRLILGQLQVGPGAGQG